MPEPRQPKAIRPLVKHSKAYEKALRAAFLDPMFANLRARLQSVESTNAAYAAMRQLVARIEALPHGGVPLNVVAQALGRVNAYHKHRMFTSFRAALAVDIRPYLHEAATQQFILERIGQNEALIRTIPARTADRLGPRLTALEGAPFNQRRCESSWRPFTNRQGMICGASCAIKRLN